MCFPLTWRRDLIVVALIILRSVVEQFHLVAVGFKHSDHCERLKVGPVVGGSVESQ